MSTEPVSPSIWIVDRLDYWRSFAAETLERGGFAVETYAHYDELPCRSEGPAHPDLVVLGCACSRADERLLVEAIVRRGWPVLILSSRLSCEDLRLLFLAGATDVFPRPDSPDLLLSLVRGDLVELALQQRRRRTWMEAAL